MSDSNSEALKNSLEPLMSCKFLFGLRNQGHIPTIMNMLRLGDSWNDIGKEIGWMWDAAKESYENYISNIDFDDPESCRQFLNHSEASIFKDDDDDKNCFWWVKHQKGTMNICHNSKSENEALVAGALFVFLWYKGGIDCGLARDLACCFAQTIFKDADKFKDLV